MEKTIKNIPIDSTTKYFVLGLIVLHYPTLIPRPDPVPEDY